MSINPQQGDLEQRRRYYDGFSARYEDGRDRGYHAFLDDEELAVILPRARGATVLEAGCGTGLLLQHVAPAARQAVGVDLSAGMAGHARARGLAVSQGDLCRLPFADGTFDLIYSCKVLAHVPQLDRVFAELDRVTKPGGTLLLEVYNRHSLRYLVRRLRPGMAVADGATAADARKGANDVLSQTGALRNITVTVDRGTDVVTVTVTGDAPTLLGSWQVTSTAQSPTERFIPPEER